MAVQKGSTVRKRTNVDETQDNLNFEDVEEHGMEKETRVHGSSQGETFACSVARKEWNWVVEQIDKNQVMDRRYTGNQSFSRTMHAQCKKVKHKK